MDVADTVELEIWHIAFAGLHLAVAAVFLVETVSENRSARRPRDGWYVVGLLSCAVWPLLVVLLVGRTLYDRARRQRC